MIKKLIITILIIMLLVMSFPVSAYADPVAVASVEAGQLAALSYAQAVGYTVSSTAEASGYLVSDASLQLFEQAISSGGYGSAIASVEAAYPEATAAMAASVGASSLASISSGSSLAGAVGSGVTVSAGSVILPVAVAAVVGAVVYLVLANSVEIPDYGISQYHRYGNAVCAVSSDITSINNVLVKVNSINGLNGVSRAYPNNSISVSNNGTVSLSTLSEQDNFADYMIRAVGSESYGYYPDLVYLGPGMSGYSSYVKLPNKITSSDDGVFLVYLPTYGGIFPCVYCSQYRYNYVNYSGYLAFIEKKVDQLIQNLSSSTQNVRQRWRQPEGQPLPIPGFGSTPADDVEITPQINGANIITSDDPAIALQEVSTAADTVNETDVGTSLEPSYIPDWVFELIDAISWDPNRPITGEPNDPTDDEDDNPNEKLPTAGLRVPWYYVERLLSDIAEGVSSLWAAWKALIPPTFLNLLYASIVIIITLGMLKRFLE